jgi:V8-like Glu-specific endopeptidase
MNDNLIFSDPKMHEEFLDRFDNLRLEYFEHHNSDNELNKVLAYTKDDANLAVTIMKEGRGGQPIDKVWEAIILRFGRPAYFVQNSSFKTENTPSTSIKVNNVVNQAKTIIDTAIPSVGRINLRKHRQSWCGTGWVVAKNVLVTNRHVASVFAQRMGEGFVFIGQAKASLDTLQEHNSLKEEKIYRLRKILWIAPPDINYDVAFLSIDKESSDDDRQPDVIKLMDKVTFDAISIQHWITVVGYPAWSPYNDSTDQQRIFDGVYGVKRMQPGQIRAKRDDGIVNHDATTLGGNSGSVVLDLTSGKAMALHFGGIEHETNSSIAAPIIAELLHKHVLDQANSEAYTPVSPAVLPQESNSSMNKSFELTNGTATWKIPLEVSLTVGTPETISLSTPSTPRNLAASEEGLFSRQPQLSLAKLTAMFSLPSLAKKTFDWHTALSLAVASELAYKKNQLLRTLLKIPGGSLTAIL